MNAEAKKKVDVLSEELLPYIIAEQERRTTLYKRVMTAIQNGEKGVSIAEIRGKPPAIIRKGLMYRCPENRLPKEPDGSGVIMCEDNIEPSPIMFESCLSAEDKELFVANNKYFFCNRHKIEGPDLPRNGSTVIGCAPCERTPLNYTSRHCALEDTDDVVVHYRYYPDRTYKYVTELDPDREVCDHWNPCQIGYIFSLPGPDQATSASELFQDYEDNKNETVVLSQSYTTSTSRVTVPAGYAFHGIGKYVPTGELWRVTLLDKPIRGYQHISVTVDIKGSLVAISLAFNPFKPTDAATYYMRFLNKNKKEKLTARQSNKSNDYKFISFLTLNTGDTHVETQTIEIVAGVRLNTTTIYFTCKGCKVRGIMWRSFDNKPRNVGNERWRSRKFTDEKGVEQQYAEIDFGLLIPQWYGDYFLILENDDGSEERFLALIIKAPSADKDNVIKISRLKQSLTTGSKLDKTLAYTCESECELNDIICKGDSVIPQGRIALIPSSKTINIHYTGFEDDNSCVYLGMFKSGDSIYNKIIAILDNASPDVRILNEPQRVDSPPEGEQFEYTSNYECKEPCEVKELRLNGIPVSVTQGTRRSGIGSLVFYLLGSDNTDKKGSIIIRINEYAPVFDGFFQATFDIDGEHITKNILEIGPPVSETSGGGAATTESAATESAASEAPDSEAPDSEAPGKTTSI
ncbi:uncharacterized protein LOC111359432 [Spodoptera litura]|uniref:Uncharacterized protein LOC111359432 n=1 Tax=Spodoptera litura TaxID=69820 RepID=A0A9J7EGS9_SPOLT|nr:uncharacterized protein LOC111359432 [Spodoptera litura]